MDCEMVGIDGINGIDSMLARVTIIDWYESIVYDQYIQPQQPFIDYRTNITGITAKDLNSSTAINIIQCRKDVINIINNKIIIGHGLKNDLLCLGISHHQWYHIRDTTKYISYMRYNHITQLYYPRKLRDLYYDIFLQKIQTIFHSSYEDSVAALHLYQIVQYKWESIMQYKINKTNEILFNNTTNNNLLEQQSIQEQKQEEQ